MSKSNTEQMQEFLAIMSGNTPKSTLTESKRRIKESSADLNIGDLVNCKTRGKCKIVKIDNDSKFPYLVKADNGTTFWVPETDIIEESKRRIKESTQKTSWANGVLNPVWDDKYHDHPEETKKMIDVEIIHENGKIVSIKNDETREALKLSDFDAKSQQKIKDTVGYTGNQKQVKESTEQTDFVTVEEVENPNFDESNEDDTDPGNPFYIDVEVEFTLDADGEPVFKKITNDEGETFDFDEFSPEAKRSIAKHVFKQAQKNGMMVAWQKWNARNS